jgi:hypothetical protein
MEGKLGKANMSKKLTLPSGATVTFRDPKTLRVKDRRRLMTTVDGVEGDLAKALALSDALISMLVEDWSFDLIIPSAKLESLDELEMADYDYLVEETKDAQKYLYPSLAETEETAKDPKASTANSNA